MKNFSTKLLKHYKKHHRPMPWRSDVSPYRVWLSEIMLQQTGVSTVIPYFERFIEYFPTVQDLAAADLDEILNLWQGLGYYSRARNLHKCANVITREFDGKFPDDVQTLESLPGIGNYTACAIQSMAFSKRAAVLDGNVERVVSRLFRIENALPKAKPEMKDMAEKLIPQKGGEHPDYALYSNAIMELGATICTPKKPKCLLCPVTEFCKSASMADVESFPRKEPKKKRPVKHADAYVITDASGRIYLQKRPEVGLLASLYEVPSIGWDKEDATLRTPKAIQKHINAHRAEKSEKTGNVKHVFTHFTLFVDVYSIKLSDNLKMSDNFYKLDNLPALPTLMKKIINA